MRILIQAVEKLSFDEGLILQHKYSCFRFSGSLPGVKKFCVIDCTRSQQNLKDITSEFYLPEPE
jgi:hypothetical protein